VKLKPESGANRIRSADDAYSFVVHMRLSHQNKPHWQMARHASIISARLTRAKFRPGEPFGRLRQLKAGFWTSRGNIEWWANTVTVVGPPQQIRNY
jgi:hypothetical protein